MIDIDTIRYQTTNDRNTIRRILESIMWSNTVVMAQKNTSHAKTVAVARRTGGES